MKTDTPRLRLEARLVEPESPELRTWRDGAGPDVTTWRVHPACRAEPRAR